MYDRKLADKATHSLEKALTLNPGFPPRCLPLPQALTFIPSQNESIVLLVQIRSIPGSLQIRSPIRRWSTHVSKWSKKSW